MKRITIKDALQKSEGEKVLLKGWIHDARDVKKLRFIILKDRTGRIQITGINGKTSKEVFEKMTSFTRESAIEVRGIIKDSAQAKQGKELLPESITIIAAAEEPLPVDASDFSKSDLSNRLDNRFLDLHSKKTQSIFKIQSTILKSYRDFMTNNNAIEVILPSIIGTSSEGGTDMFEIKYFEKSAYLSQSCQLYKQMCACSLEKVFAIFTAWRAEKHNTLRHLNESHQLDYEEAFADDKDVMKILGEFIQYMIEQIQEKNAEELEFLKINLKIPTIKYLTFNEVKKLMEKEKIKIPEHDLSNDAEKKLGELFPNTIVFVHDWPIKGKPFYIMPKGNGLSGGFDAIWKGLEIASGGERINNPELLIKQLKTNNLSPKNFTSYINSFRYGAPPHAGWALGLERLTMLVLGIENIREVTPFPRDRDRLSP
jgi:nondiscriminating aspartyl-tRNA synthetase